MSLRDPKWLAMVTTVVLAVGGGMFYLGQRDVLGDVVTKMDTKIVVFQRSVDERLQRVADMMAEQQILNAEQSRDIRSLTETMRGSVADGRQRDRAIAALQANNAKLSAILEMLCSAAAREK